MMVWRISMTKLLVNVNLQQATLSKTLFCGRSDEGFRCVVYAVDLYPELDGLLIICGSELLNDVLKGKKGWLYDKKVDE